MSKTAKKYFYASALGATSLFALYGVVCFQPTQQVVLPTDLSVRKVIATPPLKEEKSKLFGKRLIRGEKRKLTSLQNTVVKQTASADHKVKRVSEFKQASLEKVSKLKVATLEKAPELKVATLGDVSLPVTEYFERELSNPPARLETGQNEMESLELASEHEGALEVVSPLSEIEKVAFNEPPQTNEESGLEVPNGETNLVPVERGLGVVVGEIQQNEFREIREKLNEQSEAFSAVGILSDLPETQTRLLIAQAEVSNETTDSHSQLVEEHDGSASELAQEQAKGASELAQDKAVVAGELAQEQAKGAGELAQEEMESTKEIEPVEAKNSEALLSGGPVLVANQEVEESQASLNELSQATGIVSPSSQNLLAANNQSEEKEVTTQPEAEEVLTTQPEIEQAVTTRSPEPLPELVSPSEHKPETTLASEVAQEPSPESVNYSEPRVAELANKVSDSEKNILVVPKRTQDSVVAEKKQMSEGSAPPQKRYVAVRSLEATLPAPIPQSRAAVMSRSQAAVAMSLSQTRSQPEVEIVQRSALALDEKIYGRLELDRSVSEWLEDQNGHIELALHPAKSRDGQDKIQLDYDWPSDEFVVEPRGLKGNYQLVANFFTANHSHEAAQVSYSQIISQENHTQKIRFRITENALKDALEAAAVVSSSTGVRFTSVIYEVNTSSHEKLKVVEGGSVSVVGFPEWGRGEVEKDGTLRMKLPSQSEVVAYVSAPGFYPTYQVIPTFSRDVHSHLYLIPSPSKEGFSPMDAIIRAFTGRAQDPSFGIVMGRIFDPMSRQPIGNELTSISNSRAAQAMIPLTTASGFFGYTNIVPSMRAVGRPNGGRVALVNVIAGAAQYLDLGRGGKRALSGNLSDPFNGENIPVTDAAVKLVADDKSEVSTDERGNFNLEEIDLPPGVLTLEVKAEGYPVTWHNVAWNASERPKQLSLRMIPEQWVESSREANRQPKSPRSLNVGTLVGGVSKKFFKQKEMCLTVQLLNIAGREVPLQHGPFPFSGPAVASKGPFCISQQNPGYAFFDVPDGEYVLKYLTPQKRLLKTHVIRVGKNRVTVTVD